MNNATCLSYSTHYHCRCQSGFLGVQCQEGKSMSWNNQFDTDWQLSKTWSWQLHLHFVKICAKKTRIPITNIYTTMNETPLIHPIYYQGSLFMTSQIWHYSWTYLLFCFYGWTPLVFVQVCIAEDIWPVDWKLAIFPKAYTFSCGFIDSNNIFGQMDLW